MRRTLTGLAAAGLPRGSYVLKINSRKLLDGLLAEAGVRDPRQKLVTLRAVDKLDRLGWDGVEDLLGAGRLDESGAFTKGAGLDLAAIEAIGEFLDISTRDGGVLKELARLKLGQVGEEGLRDLELIDAALDGLGLHRDQARGAKGGCFRKPGIQPQRFTRARDGVSELTQLEPHTAQVVVSFRGARASSDHALECLAGPRDVSQSP